MDEILGAVDFSFKYILLAFNFMTLLAVYLYKRKHRPTKQHHILFVTAHPDDEVMFFRPTIVSLLPAYHVHILCLSPGQGPNRQAELKKSCQQLGVDGWRCVNSDKMVDGMKEKWCQETIIEEVSKQVRDKNIRALFTFDGHGVSGHSNHKSIYFALKPYLQSKGNKPKKPQTSQPSEKQKQESKEAEEVPAAAFTAPGIKIYLLQSVNILRKYSGWLQVPIAIAKDYSWLSFNFMAAWRAVTVHQSQFVWFRKLWVVFSRYNCINTFQMTRVVLPTPPQAL